MLEVGNTALNGNLTADEARTHFTAWALLKSPLLIGADVSQIQTESLVHGHVD